MKKHLFSVRDVIADTFAQPFVSHNPNTAMRDFAHACQDNSSAIFRSPESFQLFHVGFYDDESGTLESITPQLVANATQFVKE